MGCQSDTPMTVERLQKELMGTYRVAEGVAYSVLSSQLPQTIQDTQIGVEYVIQEGYYAAYQESGIYIRDPKYVVREMNQSDDKHFDLWFGLGYEQGGKELSDRTGEIQKHTPRFIIEVQTQSGEQRGRFYYIDGQLLLGSGALLRLERTDRTPDLAQSRLFEGVSPKQPAGELSAYRGELYAAVYADNWSLNGGKYPQTKDPWLRVLFHEDGDEPYVYFAGRTAFPTGEVEHEPAENWAEKFTTTAGVNGYLFCTRYGVELKANFLVEISARELPYRLAVIRMDWDCFQENREEILWFLKGIELT